MERVSDVKEKFLGALKERKKILLSYYSGEQNRFLTKLCVPIQYVPPISEYGSEYFYFWDDESEIGERTLGIPSSEIKMIVITDEVYDPRDYIIPYTSDI